MLGAVAVSEASLTDVINQAAETYGLEPALIKAIIKTESNWNINASRYEAKLGDSSWGLMQILLSTAKSVTGNSNMTISDLMVPQTNINVGAALLAQLMARYKGNLQDVMAAYNAGSAIKDKAGNYTVNNAYVQTAYGNYVMYSALDQMTQAGQAAMQQITDATSAITSDPMYLTLALAAVGAIGLVLVTR